MSRDLEVSAALLWVALHTDGSRHVVTVPMRDAQAVRVMRGIDLRNVHRHRGLHRLVHLAHNGGGPASSLGADLVNGKVLSGRDNGADAGLSGGESALSGRSSRPALLG